MGVAVLFPGQGSQSEGMADPWADHPAGAAVLEDASAAMGRDLVAGCHDPSALATTAFVQPALLGGQALTASELQAALPVEGLDVDALVLLMLELEEAGVSVEPDAYGPRVEVGAVPVVAWKQPAPSPPGTIPAAGAGTVPRWDRPGPIPIPAPPPPGRRMRTGWAGSSCSRASPCF